MAEKPDQPKDEEQANVLVEKQLKPVKCVDEMDPFSIDAVDVTQSDDSWFLDGKVFRPKIRAELEFTTEEGTPLDPEYYFLSYTPEWKDRTNQLLGPSKLDSSSSSCLPEQTINEELLLHGDDALDDVFNNDLRKVNEGLSFIFMTYHSGKKEWCLVCSDEDVKMLEQKRDDLKKMHFQIIPAIVWHTKITVHRSLDYKTGVWGESKKRT